MKSLYICDKQACGSSCPNPACFHTADAAHAVNSGRIEWFYLLDGNLWQVHESLNPAEAKGKALAYIPRVF